MHNDFSTTLLKKIEQEQIVPQSRMRVIARRMLVWMPGVLASVVGMLAVALILFQSIHAGWSTAFLESRSGLAFFFANLPLLWVVLMVVFSWLAVRSLRITRTGYRWKASLLILSVVLISIIGGVVLYGVGTARNLDVRLSGTASLQSRQLDRWHDPARGRLAGEITTITDYGFALISPDEKVWAVTNAELLDREASIYETLVRKKKEVRIVGYIDEQAPEDTFNACLVLPLVSPNGPEGRMLPPREELQRYRAGSDNLTPACRRALMEMRRSIQ